jgi:oligoribonuclease NrnB/cAMP/cGMP phosphodiesterase (DHH superfamily)
MASSASEENQVVLCMHHNDADGRCSAAIVRRALGAGVMMREMDYEVVPIPWDDIAAAGKILIVDFSFPLEHMQRMMSMAEVIWIDHHKSSLEALADLNDLPGLRNLEEAACVLTWKFFFPDQAVPIAVNYIGDRDVWRFAFEQTAAFCEGLFQENTHPSNDALWAPLLDGDDEMVHRLIEIGEILYQARMKQIERRVKQDTFEVEFEGHRTLVINSRGSGDLGHAMCREGYEVAYCYIDGYHNGRMLTNVALFSEEVDVSVIASRFSGGGHPGAAGFTFERTGNPFPGKAEVGFG